MEEDSLTLGCEHPKEYKLEDVQGKTVLELATLSGYSPTPAYRVYVFCVSITGLEGQQKIYLPSDKLELKAGMEVRIFW